MNLYCLLIFHCKIILSSQNDNNINLLVHEIYYKSLTLDIQEKIKKNGVELINTITEMLVQHEIFYILQGLDVILKILKMNDKSFNNNFYNSRFLDSLADLALFDAKWFLNSIEIDNNTSQMKKDIECLDLKIADIYRYLTNIFSELSNNIVAEILLSNAENNDPHHKNVFYIKDKLECMILNIKFDPDNRAIICHSLLNLFIHLQDQDRKKTFTYLLSTISQKNLKELTNENTVLRYSEHFLFVAHAAYEIISPIKNSEEGFITDYTIDLYNILSLLNLDFTFKIRLFILFSAGFNYRNHKHHQTIQDFMPDVAIYIESFHFRDKKHIFYTTMIEFEQITFILGSFIGSSNEQDISIMKIYGKLAKSYHRARCNKLKENKYFKKIIKLLEIFGYKNPYINFYDDLTSISNFAIGILDKTSKQTIIDEIYRFFERYINYLHNMGQTVLFLKGNFLVELINHHSLLKDINQLAVIFTVLLNFKWAGEDQMSKYQTFRKYFTYNNFKNRSIATNEQYCRLYLIVLAETINMIENEDDLDDFLKQRKDHKFRKKIAKLYSKNLQPIINFYINLLEKVKIFYDDKKRKAFFVDMRLDRNFLFTNSVNKTITCEMKNNIKNINRLYRFKAKLE